MNLTSVRVASVVNAFAGLAAKPSSLGFKNAVKKTLQNIIRGHVSLDSVIHSDGWRGYNGLVDVDYSKHLRINHADDVFAIVRFSLLSG